MTLMVSPETTCTLSMTYSFTTPELKDLALHWAYEGARMRWFYFDGIFLHYEMGYSLA